VQDLEGKVAVVTGSGGQHGIGRATASRLAQEGARAWEDYGQVDIGKRALSMIGRTAPDSYLWGMR